MSNFFFAWEGRGKGGGQNLFYFGMEKSILLPFGNSCFGGMG